MLEGEKESELARYLSHRVRVEVEDGRYFDGRFMCVDKQKNLVLSEAEEFRKRMVRKQPVDWTSKEAFLATVNRPCVLVCV